MTTKTHAIARDTFEVTGPAKHGSGSEGTVEVTLGRETRRVPAWRGSDKPDATIMAFGMYGTYRTSANRWPAHIASRIRENGDIFENAHFGRDDRSGRFNKLAGIAFGEA